MAASPYSGKLCIFGGKKFALSSAAAIACLAGADNGAFACAKVALGQAPTKHTANIPISFLVIGRVQEGKFREFRTREFRKG